MHIDVVVAVRRNSHEHAQARHTDEKEGAHGCHSEKLGGVDHRLRSDRQAAMAGAALQLHSELTRVPSHSKS